METKWLEMKVLRSLHGSVSCRQAGLRPGGDHSIKNNNSVDFYYYSKYNWSVISCTNTEPINRNTTGLNWTKLDWKSRIKSKQNLCVSLSPEVWQKCFVAARSWSTSFTSCRSVIATDIDLSVHWTDQWEGSSAGPIRSFLKADWSFSSEIQNAERGDFMYYVFIVSVSRGMMSSCKRSWLAAVMIL